MDLREYIDKLIQPSPRWKQTLSKALKEIDNPDLLVWLEETWVSVTMHEEGATASTGSITDGASFPKWGKSWWVQKLVESYSRLERVVMDPDLMGHLYKMSPEDLYELRAGFSCYLLCACALEHMDKNSVLVFSADEAREQYLVRVRGTLQLIHDKSDDYGQSFRRFPLLCCTTRMWEKISRYLNLMGKEAKFESLGDTLSDMVGWGLIGYAATFE